MDIHEAIERFEKSNYSVKYFSNRADASQYLTSVIKQKSVGFGDALTLTQMEMFEVLSADNCVYDPQQAKTNEKFIELAKKSLTTDIFITSVNAFSATGELVNIDGTGNRVAGSLFGHEKVYFVIGINKGEDSLEKAIWRARNIAAPLNAKRLGLKTPCAIKGDKCYDCSSKDRICNALTIYYKAMDNIQSEIVFVGESLGF